MATRPTNPTPAVSEEAEICGHGTPMLVDDRLAAVKGYLERREKRSLYFKAKYQGQEFSDHQREEREANVESLKQFWSELQHAALIDAKMVRFCFAFAAQTSLHGDTELSRRLAVLSVYHATWFKLGKDAFLNTIMGSMPVETQTMLDFYESMRKIGTDRGLVLFLSKQIPCTCLDEDKKNAKQAPKTEQCSYCLSESLKLELKKCSRCKALQYCSKKCQVGDWKAGHKKECEMWKLARAQEDAYKYDHTRP
jgi:hypothetical protein